MSRPQPTSLSTGYDLLPIPTSLQFELDRNLPLPARRVTVEQLGREIDGHVREDVVTGKEGDGTGWEERVGKVRVYGRVLQVCYALLHSRFV